MICIGAGKNFFQLLCFREYFTIELTIKWYSFTYFISFILIRYLVKKYISIQYLDHVDNFMFVIFTSGVLGGRIWHILMEMIKDGYYSLEDIAKLHHGGLAIQGGLVGAWIGGGVYCKMHKMNIYAFSDHIVRFLPIGMLLGRLGNFANGDFIYPTPFGIPLCILSAITEGIILGVFINLFYILYHAKTGDTLFAFCGLYGIVRFFNDTFRKEPIVFLSLRFSQWFCVVLICISLKHFISMQKK